VTFQTAKLFATIFAVLSIALVFNEVLRRLESRITH
jgi:ABC-type nitrate/sulfonate/bicarbonate transport system permease component